MKDFAWKVNWYLSYEVLYFEPESLILQREYVIWENLILIKADNPEAAFKKAVEHGKLSEGEVTINESKGRCKFKGLKKLVPICEEIEDGAEIEWREYEVSKEDLETIVVAKENLLAFELSKEKTS